MKAWERRGIPPPAPRPPLLAAIVQSVRFRQRTFAGFGHRVGESQFGRLSCAALVVCKESELNRDSNNSRACARVDAEMSSQVQIPDRSAAGLGPDFGDSTHDVPDVGRNFLFRGLRERPGD